MKRLLAILVMSSFGVAYAQPAEKDPAQQIEKDEPAGEGAKHDAHVGHDPTKDFNWLSGPGAHYGKDVKGGPLGDGVMLDEHGNVIIEEHVDKDGKVTRTPAAEEPKSPAFIWLILNFVLLLVILAKYGKPAIEKLAADRHDQIKTALDEADRLRKQAAEKLAEYDSKLAQAKSEIAKMVEGMRIDAEADKKRILENAERQAEQMKREAQQRIDAELEYARAALTREVTLAATAATEKLLREQMTTADQQKVVGAFITNVQAAGGEKAAR